MLSERLEAARISARLMDMRNRIAAVRRSKGLTQIDLADRLGINQGSVSRLERSSGGVRLDTLKRVADALECEVADLYDESSKAEHIDNLVSIYEGLSADEQQMLLALAETLAARKAQTK